MDRRRRGIYEKSRKRDRKNMYKDATEIGENARENRGAVRKNQERDSGG